MRVRARTAAYKIAFKLQSKRTVTEQDLSFWLLAALLWNHVNVTCDIFCILWAVTSSVFVDAR